MRKIVSLQLKTAQQDLHTQIDALVDQWVRTNFRNPKPVDFEQMKNLALKVSNLTLEYAKNMMPNIGEQK